MPQRKPTIHLIAGCNGQGKTTFALEYLPNEVKCLRFLNPDEIAQTPTTRASTLPSAATFDSAA